MMSSEFVVHTYGLALFLIGARIKPLCARKTGLTTTFIFPAEAKDYLADFQRARRHLTALQHEAERPSESAQ